MAAALQRTGVLIVRIWQEPGAASGARLRVTAVGDVERAPQEGRIEVFADAQDAVRFIGAWLEAWPAAFDPR